MAESWRGLTPTIYKLGRNYRSVPGIVRLANQIQSCMNDTIPLVMTSQREEEGRCTSFLQSATPRDIAGGIAERISQDNRPKDSTLRFRDNVVLVRAKSQIKDVELEMIRCRVPYVIRGGQGVFQSREAKDLVAYLRIVSNPQDVVAFTRACSTPKRGIGDAGIRALSQQAAKGHNGDLVKAAVDSPNPKLHEFGTLVTQLRHMVESGTGVLALLTQLIDQIGFKALVIARYRADETELETKLIMLDKILEAIDGIEASLTNASLEDVVFRLTMDKEDESKEEDGGGKAVISTIHSAKGLEWERVFVVNLYEGSLPHSWARSEAEIEEERRLFYVACTRARRLLYLCVPHQCQIGPKLVSATPSRFIDELRAKRT
jgi:superfamily I DNA/RNA helicase